MDRIFEACWSHRCPLGALTVVGIGVISGYDVASVAGALLYIADEFNLTIADQELLTAALALGDIAGAVVGGLLANAIGRRRSLHLVVAAYAGFAVLGAVAVSFPVLVAARLLAGWAIGVSYVVVPVYVAESAPARVRGALLVAYQATNVAGMALGYFGAYLVGSHWRWVLGLAAVPAVLMLPLLRRINDSARWYMLKGRIIDARRALLQVEPDADVETDLAAIGRAIAEGDEAGGALAEMTREPYRRATVFVIVLGFLVQATGINAVVSYSPRIFEALGFTGDFALLMSSALIQVLALIAVFGSLVLVDRIGRRPVLLAGIGIMCAANLLLIVSFLSGATSGGMPALCGVFGVLLFAFGFNVGFGPLACVYAGESLPSRLRSVGSAVMHTANLVANAAVVAVFLTVLTSLGGAMTFAILGILSMAGFGFVHRFAPETKDRQLEDLRHVWVNLNEQSATQLGSVSRREDRAGII